MRNTCFHLQERKNHQPQETIEGQKFQLLTFIQSSFILIKGLSFDPYILESIKNPRKNPINTLKKIWKGEKEKREKHEGNSLLIDYIMKVQRPNIKGLTSFEKSRKWNGKKKRKEKGGNNL